MKNILVLLADWANGVFAVVLAGWITNTEIIWWHFLIGILFAMCPDLDAIPELLQRGKLSASAKHTADHRDGLHYPILFLLVGGVSAYMFPFFGSMFLIATLLHFLNDFYGTGWGIQLLWPFTNRRYKLLGRKANRMKYVLVAKGDWDNLSDDERRLRFVVSWTGPELPHYIQKWGMDEWITPYYFRLNWISGIEYGLFLFAITLVATTLLY